MQEQAVSVRAGADGDRGCDQPGPGSDPATVRPVVLQTQSSSDRASRRGSWRWGSETVARRPGYSAPYGTPQHRRDAVTLSGDVPLGAFPFRSHDGGRAELWQSRLSASDVPP